MKIKRLNLKTGEVKHILYRFVYFIRNHASETQVFLNYALLALKVLQTKMA